MGTSAAVGRRTAARSQSRARLSPQSPRAFQRDLLSTAVLDAARELGRFPTRIELEASWPGVWELLAGRGGRRYWRAVVADGLDLDALGEDDGEGDLFEHDPTEAEGVLLGLARECCERS